MTTKTETTSFKIDADLKQAILNVACNQGHGKKGTTIYNALAEHPEISKELAIIKRKNKKLQK